MDVKNQEYSPGTEQWDTTVTDLRRLKNDLGWNFELVKNWKGL